MTRVNLSAKILENASKSDVVRRDDSAFDVSNESKHQSDTTSNNYDLGRMSIFSLSHNIQPKLKINNPNDRFEKEADSMADQVMRMSEPNVQRKCSTCGGHSEEADIQRAPLATQISHLNHHAPLQKKCAKCEEEEQQGTIQTKSNSTSPQTASSTLSSQIKNTKGGGKGMNQTTQTFMESRFGVDFSGVRIHANNQAAGMNRQIQARAFTVGNDVYFNQGEYAPESSRGKHLLAHELTHVIQQGSEVGEKSSIQRMKAGTGNPPARWVKNYKARSIPKTDISRINSAISMIRNVATNPDKYSSCHKFFKDKCPGGKDNTLQQTFNNAILWKADRKKTLAFATVNGTNIAYTQSGYNSGARALAATLVHEMLHSCGIDGGKKHHLADVAGLYCIGNANEFSISVGPAFNADIMSVIISYRRLLADIGSGQFQLTAGADLNYTGTLAVIADPQSIAEIGSLMTGIRSRSNMLFGGERFGGLTGRLEAGMGMGRFRVRDAATGTSRPEIGAGFVLQTGIGAEFYIPIGVHSLPFSIEATYRLVVPLNQPAQEIHSVLGNIGLHF